MTETKSFLSKMFGPSEPEEGTVRFPLSRIVFGPYFIFMNHFREFFFTAAFFALLMSVVYLVGGQSMFCGLGLFEQKLFCSNNLYFYIGTRLIVLLIVAAFCVRYFQTAWLGNNLSWKFILTPQKKDLTSFFALVVFILLNAISGLSWYLLAVRVPNPDWRIELTYFAVVALGFLVPFILLRFYSIFALIWNGEKISSLTQMWLKTRGNALRLIFSLTLWFFLFVFSLSAVSVNFNIAAQDNSFYIIFIGEYVFNFVVLILMSFFINFCGLQNLFLTEGNVNERTENN